MISGQCRAVGAGPRSSLLVSSEGSEPVLVAGSVKQKLVETWPGNGGSVLSTFVPGMLIEIQFVSILFSKSCIYQCGVLQKRGVLVVGCACGESDTFVNYGIQ